MPDEDSTTEKQAKADEEAKKEGKEAADPVEPVTKSQEREVWDWRVQNDNKPLWTRTPRDVRYRHLPCSSSSRRRHVWFSKYDWSDAEQSLVLRRCRRRSTASSSR